MNPYTYAFSDSPANFYGNYGGEQKAPAKKKPKKNQKKMVHKVRRPRPELPEKEGVFDTFVKGFKKVYNSARGVMLGMYLLLPC